MAASHRSPLMSDQWRAEDQYKDSARSRRRRSDERQTSPAPGRRADKDEDLKIKGRATAEAAPITKSECKSYKSKEEKSSRAGAVRGPSRSPRPQFRIDEPGNRPRDTSEQRYPRRQRYRDGQKKAIKRRRTRSVSPPQGTFASTDLRKGRRSPIYSGADRATRARSRRRERTRSPARRGDRYSSSRPDLASIAGRLGDSYVPPVPSRRYSRSRDRHPRSRKPSPPPFYTHRRLSRDRISRDEREPASSYRPLPRSQHSLRRHESERGHRTSQSPSAENYIRPTRRRRSRSSFGREKMQPLSRPTPSTADDGPRPPSPPRPIPSFDSSSQNPAMVVSDQFPLHGMKASDVRGGHRGPRAPHLDTRQHHNASPHWTPTSSHHGSPLSGSPFSQGRGGWGAQPQQYNSQSAYSPPYRQGSYPPQQSPHGQYYPNGQPVSYGPGPQHVPFRGGHSGFRGGHYGQTPERRMSGPAPSTPNPTSYGIAPARGRGGHFQNLQWTANSASRGRGQSDQTPPGHSQSYSHQQSGNQADDEDNPFRPSKDLQVEDQTAKDAKIQPPTPQPSETSAKDGKFKFSFKPKAATPVSTKPPPDMTQKLKDHVRKEIVLENPKAPSGPRSAEAVPMDHPNKRDDRRDRGYRARNDRRDDRDYRRTDFGDQRRPDREREQRRDRARERSPEPRMEKKIMKRSKYKRTLSPDMATSTSVYYRKPGNESVVGSGTYGKVFKAIHVYTKNLAALKKIRMDGEKDGFPVTAIREIKLLQSLKHDNVVSLQEVMVEHNDCFMVFEYLSHDLTGLLNHPTFKLEHAHKKHLAKQLFEGLNYLHRRCVLHRDIKAANILVSSTGQLKLADFGLARFYSKRGQPDYTNRVITIWYRSPELLLGETQYGPAVDIWSAACVMVEIFTRHAIFPGDGGEINQLDKIYNVLGTPTRSEWPGLVEMAWFELLRPTERKPNTFAEKYQGRVTPATFELLQAMLLYDPNKRPSAGDVLEHPYFTAEEPAPRQAIELKDLDGDWHEFESKALRKENERKNQEARRAVRLEEHEKEKAKRRASGPAVAERDAKRTRPSFSHGEPASN